MVNLDFENQSLVGARSSDDFSELPASFIDAICAQDPELARRSFEVLSKDYVPNITARKMAGLILQDLAYGRKPTVTPLLQAKRIGKDQLDIDIEEHLDKTAFNRSFLNAVGIDYEGDTSSKEQLQNLIQAYIGGFTVELVAVTNTDELTDAEKAFETIPFPALRLTFLPIDY